MALPQPDPSLPSGPTPLFSDVDAARGDHLRANNQAVWENLQFLNDGGNINAATAKNPPVDADELPLADSAATYGLKKLTFANLFLWIVSKIAALTAKTTPVDADGLLLIDSAASNAGKFLSWSNLKATLKTYFDTLYLSFSAATPVAWTPTFTGFGSVSNISAYSWRVGSMLHFQITFTAGTDGGVENRVSLGFNGTDGNVTSASNYAAIASGGNLVGNAQTNSNTGNYPVLVEASKTYIVFGIQNTTAAGLNKASLGIANGAYVSLFGAVRIQGW